MTGGMDDEYGYQDDTPPETRSVGAEELKIVRLALRRMVVTAKKKPSNKIVPLFQKPKMKLGVSHRKKK